MATLNLNKKKSFSDSNMKRIINILVGLMSSVSTLEDQCIKEYDETKTYQKGQIVVGSDGYFYEAKTVASGVFDSSKWTKIGTDDITELSIDDIKAMLGLTQDQIDYLAKLIADDTIVLDHTWSSSKSYTEIQEAIKTAKEFCVTELAKKSTGSFKKANDVSEVTDGSYFYLIYNNGTSKYDIYALLDNNVELLTSVDIDLSQYFTKTEIEADFLKKTDADGKYATITTVDGKVDKTSIIAAKNNSATDDQVYSAKSINTELDGVVKKVDISTTIDSTSTNDTVPTNKSVWDSLYKICDPQVLTDANNPTSKICMADLTTLNTPSKEGITNAESSLIISVEGRDYWNGQISITMAEPEVYVRSVREAGTWTKWRKLCSSSVADVPKTTINLPDISSEFTTGYIEFEVFNGVCYMALFNLIFANTSTGNLVVNIPGIPKRKSDGWHTITNVISLKPLVVNIGVNGGSIEFFTARETGTSYYGTFSYLVAES